MIVLLSGLPPDMESLERRRGTKYCILYYYIISENKHIYIYIAQAEAIESNNTKYAPKEMASSEEQVQNTLLQY